MTVVGSGSFFERFEAAGGSAGIDQRAAAALLRGVHPKDVSEGYGVSLRTAYRWRATLVALEVVSVDGWTATFARRRGQPPKRVSAWERAG